MKTTIEIETCDYPGCLNDRGLAPCMKCGMVVCANHRFEGIQGAQAVFICWMDLPQPSV